MHTITISRRPKDLTGPYEYTVKLDLDGPLVKGGPTPPALELFKTREEADAHAEKLQADLGGPDKAKIIFIDAPAVFATPAGAQRPSSRLLKKSVATGMAL
jgi:hypothetical protein